VRSLKAEGVGGLFFWSLLQKVLTALLEVGGRDLYREAGREARGVVE